MLQLRDSSLLRAEYRMLLSDLPPIALQKVGAGQLATEAGRAQTMGQLVDTHGGELVELDRTRADWFLQAVPPGSASAPVGEQ